MPPTTTCVAGQRCPHQYGGSGKRLVKDGVRTATIVYMHGKEHRHQNSIMCTYPECMVLCCVDEPLCIAALKVHLETHHVRAIDRVETHSIALFWRFFFSAAFDNHAAAVDCFEALLRQKRFSQYWMSHSGVQECGRCHRAFGPATFSVSSDVTEVKWYCTTCFMSQFRIEKPLQAFQHEACYLRWSAVDMSRLRMAMECFHTKPKWVVQEAHEIQPYIFSLCGPVQSWPSIVVQGRCPVVLGDCSVDASQLIFADCEQSITVKKGNLRREVDVRKATAILAGISTGSNKDDYLQPSLNQFQEHSVVHWWRSLFHGGIPKAETGRSITENTLVLIAGDKCWTPVFYQRTCHFTTHTSYNIAVESYSHTTFGSSTWTVRRPST